MSNTFDPLLNPLDPTKEALLASVVTLANRQGIPIMLLGAYAREVHFYHAFNIEGGRATEDMDLSIQVPDWASYDAFREVLLENDFVEDTTLHPEKLKHPETGLEIDLLPFGQIAEDGKNIVWPVDESPWSIIGLQDAFNASKLLKLNDPSGDTVIIPVVPVPAMVALKLFAIKDRPEVRHKKDGTDIAFIITHYLDIGNRLRLSSGKDSDIMSQVDNDLQQASAILLGRDIVTITSEHTREAIIEILEHEVGSASRCYVARGMKGSSFPGFPQAKQGLQAILDGIRP